MRRRWGAEVNAVFRLDVGGRVGVVVSVSRRWRMVGRRSRSRSRSSERSELYRIALRIKKKKSFQKTSICDRVRFESVCVGQFVEIQVVHNIPSVAIIVSFVVLSII